MFELSLINVKKYMESTLVLNNVTFQVYSSYVKQKDEYLMEQLHDYNQQQKEIKKIKKENPDAVLKRLEAEKSKLEAKISFLENEIENLETSMNDPELAYDEFCKIYNDKEELERELEETMEQWVKIAG